MRYIYTWHEDTQMHGIRVATEEEENRISEALKLFKQCRSLHDSIINDANSLYNGEEDVWHKEKPVNYKYGEVIVNYAILPDYDRMLEVEHK